MTVILATAVLYVALWHETTDPFWLCAAVFFAGAAVVKA